MVARKARLLRQAEPSLRNETQPAEPPSGGRAIRSAADVQAVGQGALFVESPARQLQISLEEAWAPAQTPSWSPRRKLAIVVASNLILWAVLIAGVRALL